jgi:hypothetical protein
VDTPHLAPIVRSLILIEDLAPVAPAIKVVDVDAEGEDDVWYIPPILHRQIHPLNKYSTSCVDPLLEYVEDVREDEWTGPHQDDLPADGSEDELWANLGVNLRST